MQKIADNVWKFSRNSNVYLLKLGKNILIDCGEKVDRKDLIDELGKLNLKTSDIDVVIFTHLHYDHCGNFDAFGKAEFYASQKEITSFEKDAHETVLNKQTADALKKIKLKDVSELKIPELTVINTPGHTRGSICILYSEKKILFSGDTLFRAGYGRTDLPTSVSAELEKSIKRLEKLEYDVICPGHDY